MPKIKKEKETLLVAVAYNEANVAINHISGYGSDSSMQVSSNLAGKLRNMNPDTVRVDIHVLRRVNFEKVHSFKV